ncbi:MAG: DUF362 domain-containing protein [Defluviitaleaceae bacterium]|nr:DUF362 domain-containing protein [Defluviitaleaceae bacterium]
MDKMTDIGFAFQLIDRDNPHALCDKEVYDMVDKVIYQTLGKQGLRALIKPADHVTLKVNLVGAHLGARGEKGRAIITDPRIVRHVAEKAREATGPRGVIRVIGTTHYADRNPSLREESTSFYWAKLGRSGNNAIHPDVDVCYDADADGILDGTSGAQLINLDSLGENERFQRVVPLQNGTQVAVAFPKLLRTREEAHHAGEPHEYTDIFIGLPIFKTHGLMGMTGALKLHYGLRSMYGVFSDAGRYGHNGLFFDENGTMQGRHNLTDYLCAQHLVRSYDFTILDALTLNLQGPALPMGLITDIADTDQRADYIQTHCVLAARDPLALDTVATNLMAFEKNSLPLFNDARANGLGENNPAYIRIHDNRAFCRVRNYFWNQFHPAQFPPPPRVGAQALSLTQINPDFNIFLHSATKIDPHKYRVHYELATPSQPNKIIRIELYAHKMLLHQKNDHITPIGEMVIDLNQEQFRPMRNTALAVQGFVYDEYFNCRAGNEHMIFRA